MRGILQRVPAGPVGPARAAPRRVHGHDERLPDEYSKCKKTKNAEKKCCLCGGGEVAEEEEEEAPPAPAPPAVEASGEQKPEDASGGGCVTSCMQHCENVCTEEAMEAWVGGGGGHRRLASKTTAAKASTAERAVQI